MGSQTKPFRSADAAPFLDYVDYGQRDMFFSGQGNPPSAATRLPMTPSSSFPPIGTFSLESASMSASATPAGQSAVFGGGDSMSVLNNSSSGGTIGVFSSNSILNSSGSSGGGSNGGGNSSNNNNSYGGGPPSSNGVDANQGTRETGIIEKLLHSYGFIQCCERQARLFFHFSQFGGTIEHLKIGDPVEFEMTYDRRTGKPIASQVTKIAPEVVLSEERVTGTVTTELKTELSSSASSDTTTGRISYENRGECFFLPYTKDDVEGNVNLRAGDKVSFQIATNQRGNLGACHIRLENPAHPVKYRGVVCSMKDTFGFIERADVVKEIFFHFSETDNIELRPGDDVEFIIQTRNGKEVACNIARLAPGSVIFEDVNSTIYKGQVLKSLDRNNALRQGNDPLPGRIRYRAADHSEVEVPFGDKDQKGDFTLRHGDWVQFLLATDRRDQLQRATSISLLDETFQVSGEKREQGVVASLKEGFGFLRCVERNIRLFFHFTEVLDTSREICIDDEVEFTVIQDPGSSFANTRQSAIRIKHLPLGSVKFETLIESNVEGIVSREAPKSPIKSQERTEGGVISYGQSPNKKTIMYFLKDCDKAPRVGDKIRFNICQVKRNKELIATNIQEITNNSNQLQQQTSINAGGDSQQILQQQQQQQQSQQIQLTSLQTLQQQPHSPSAGMNNGNRTMNNNSSIMKVSYANGNIKSGKIHHGFIAVLKENFGFIETIDHDQEVFFHFSNFIGNTSTLELGQEVEYSLSSRSSVNAGNCIPAENVKIIPKGSIPQPKVLPSVYSGVVLRPLRCINPDQLEYCGLVQVRNENGDAQSTHEFGITSLKNKRDLLQKDDGVTFKIDEQNRAVEVTSIRTKKQAKVDSVKGLYGFLDFEVEEGKKLFFHMSEVQGGGSLYPGDTVEFSIVTNQRNGKTSACNMIKVSDTNGMRAERLLSRIKINSVDDSGPRLMVLRAPKGPDGTIGFHISVRAPRLVGIWSE
ncbi:cold shock domain-containing protein E1 isoform X2 [Toxorhynchites rutilus septentrionalis]|uniref:cold shock domain-containing protein E1 isoform X2 n=1 Tax=Toxorhynchites rutilus septentrionalis TaxID=329112 RepID=UPI002478E7FE|nr:cold shock domain-containing protein E1 isoform X2 [Toxorhynchites rutilus septentrionalis]